jgi:hypothetical protein
MAAQRTNTPPQQPVTTATVTPQPGLAEQIPSLTPEVQSTLYSFVAQPILASLAYHEYDPKEWELIPGSEHLSDSRVFLDPNHRLWQTDGQHLIYFDGKSWGKIVRTELNYDRLYLMTMSPDGTLWLIGDRPGRCDLIRYKNDHIVSWQIPDTTDTNFIPVTDDHKQGVWVAIFNDDLIPKHLLHFDGLDWQEYPLPFNNKLNWFYLVTDARGYLWLVSSGNAGFARFDGKTWYEYKPSDFWWKNPNHTDTILVTPGPDGSVWAVMGYFSTPPTLSTIIRFYPDGRMDRISQSFMGEDFGYNMDMFVDSKNYLWMSSPRPSDKIAPLVYWDGSHWNTFSQLPFNRVGMMLEQDGRLFIQSNTGWYWYTLKK